MEINLLSHFYKLENEGVVIVALSFGLSRSTCDCEAPEGERTELEKWQSCIKCSGNESKMLIWKKRFF